MRVIGMDIHRTFAEAVMIDGDRLIRLGRVNMSRDHLAAFAAKLTHDDNVVVDATGNAQAVVEAVAPFVSRVVIANLRRCISLPRRGSRPTSSTRRYSPGCTPAGSCRGVGAGPEDDEPPPPSDAAQSSGASAGCLKTMIQAILHAHLVPQCPHADVAGPKGRAWLLVQILPDDEVAAIERHLREYDRLTEDLRVLERELARYALGSDETKRLMPIPGIDMVVAVGLLAAIGPVDRFPSPAHLVAFLGLNPSVHQSGNSPARHGCITKQGPCHARTMLVEAAWQAVRGQAPCGRSTNGCADGAVRMSRQSPSRARSRSSSGTC
jgi:transposase